MQLQRHTDTVTESVSSVLYLTIKQRVQIVRLILSPFPSYRFSRCLDHCFRSFRSLFESISIDYKTLQLNYFVFETFFCCFLSSVSRPRGLFDLFYYILNRSSELQCNCQSTSQAQIRNNMGLRIAGDNLVQWRFDNVEINYVNLSLTGILKLNFVAYFSLREKFETTPSRPKQQRK